MNIIFRKDLPGWSFTTVGALRDLLNKSELPDHLELFVNSVNNLALCEPDPTYHGHGTRWYVGYIDLPASEVHMIPGYRGCHSQGDDGPWPDQNPFVQSNPDDGTSVDGSGHMINDVFRHRPDDPVA